jgi:hypothetical protein
MSVARFAADHTPFDGQKLLTIGERRSIFQLLPI